ncbi:MAG: alpha/beta hydrolase [Mycolicibacterium cosmeticum]|nr:alpha/beta hydrolase [Mycolicibacterium cosmeticum]
MASVESGLLKALYESIVGRMAADPDMDLVTLRSMFEELGSLAKEPEDVTYAEIDQDGVRGLWCLPVGAPDDRAILYTHGGGFVGNTASSHRKLSAHLAGSAGVRVFSLEYRLAPEHPFPAQVEDSLAAYRWLRSQGLPPNQIATAGDSAGGNLAITLPLQLKDLGEPAPAAVVAFSPWLDMEHLGETLKTNAEKDALVSTAVVTMLSQMFLGQNGSPTAPLANPLFADFAGYPPLHVAASTDEALFSDSERLVERATNAGVTTELRAVNDQQHVFPFLAGRAPEADEAIAAAAAWIRRHLAD